VLHRPTRRRCIHHRSSVRWGCSLHVGPKNFLELHSFPFADCKTRATSPRLLHRPSRRRRLHHRLHVSLRRLASIRCHERRGLTSHRSACWRRASIRACRRGASVTASWWLAPISTSGSGCWRLASIISSWRWHPISSTWRCSISACWLLTTISACWLLTTTIRACWRVACWRGASITASCRRPSISSCWRGASVRACWISGYWRGASVRAWWRRASVRACWRRASISGCCRGASVSGGWWEASVSGGWRGAISGCWGVDSVKARLGLGHERICSVSIIYEIRWRSCRPRSCPSFCEDGPEEACWVFARLRRPRKHAVRQTRRRSPRHSWWMFSLLTRWQPA